MSVDSNVFLVRDRMPSPAQIQAELNKHGFPLEIDTDFDVYEMQGFLPCKYKGVECGFEYYFEDVDLDGFVSEGSLYEEERAELGERSSLLTLVTRSSFRDGLSASLVCAVVCALSDGMWADGGEPPFIPASEAIATAKEFEEAAQADIEAESSET